MKLLIYQENKMDILNLIFYIIGYLFIYAGADVGRKPDSIIKSGSKDWWLQLFLIIIGVFIINQFIN